MDIKRLESALSAFTDQAGSLILERGELIVQIGEELISAKTVIRDGQVIVIEGEKEQRAEPWLVHRVANLDSLADRLLTTFPIEKAFVCPSGDLIDSVERAPNGVAVPVADALSTVQGVLGRRPAGTCSVLYLTSDAGEGKTTLINQLAHNQAVQFKQRTSDWLLVPISLGGRPFLRFDDVVAAALLNQLRFRRLYFEGFLQLVRLGYVIPALDGFEEVFVETTEGDAVSSLGNLIRQMEGEGSLLIAARKAYFEFKGLDRQARLIDALPDADVAFGRLKLNRWAQEEFLQYCQYHSVQSPASLYQQLEARMGADHPLLTRAVFVKRLVEIANSADRQTFLEEIRPEQDYFSPFIDKILTREMTEKWIDKYGEPPQPLLTIDDHHRLLRLLAEEMWISKSGSLSLEMCGSLAELFCEMRQLNPVSARQVRERLPQHALLVSVGTSQSQIAFDHDHFREFFLGEQIGVYLAESAMVDLRKMLRIDVIPSWALDAAVSVALRTGGAAGQLISYATATAKSDSPASFVRENCGALCIRLLERSDELSMEIKDLTFPGESMRGRSILNANFYGCYFRPCTLTETHLEKITFSECEFERLYVGPGFRCTEVTFANCRIHALSIEKLAGDEYEIYDPAKIDHYLALIGAQIRSVATSGEESAESVGEIIESDVELQIVRKILMIFMRSTQVSDHVLNLRLGVHAHKFFSEIEGDLLSAGVLEQVKHTGSGSIRRYRLGKQVATIEEALGSSDGLYSNFLAVIRSRSGIGLNSRLDD